MELFDEKLTKSTTFGDHNLVQSIRIVVCNKRYPCIVCHLKLWITRPCHVQETSLLAGISQASQCEEIIDTVDSGFNNFIIYLSFICRQRLQFDGMRDNLCR